MLFLLQFVNATNRVAFTTKSKIYLNLLFAREKNPSKDKKNRKIEIKLFRLKLLEIQTTTPRYSSDDDRFCRFLSFSYFQISFVTNATFLKQRWYIACHGFRQLKQDNYFEVIFDHFLSNRHFFR